MELSIINKFLIPSLLLIATFCGAETTSLDVDVMRSTIDDVKTAMTVKNWDKAEEGLRILLSAMPDSLEYYLWMGKVLDHQGRSKEALTVLEKGLQMADDPNVHHELSLRSTLRAQLLTAEGAVYQKAGQSQNAIAALVRAVASDPHSSEAHLDLCSVYVGIGKMKEAVAACTHAVMLNRTSSEAHYLKASALYANGIEDEHGDYKVPAGTRAALQMYLDLAPAGTHAADVKTMLQVLSRKSKS